MPTAVGTQEIGTLVRRPQVGSCPKEYRDVCNTLIDEQGWTFVEGKKGKKHRLYPPTRQFSFVGVPSTPSSHGSFLTFISNLRRRGAMIDENGNSTFVPEPVFSDHKGVLSVKMPEIDPTVQPISTIGNRWWAPESEPEPEPEPEPVITLRPENDPDRRGTVYTLHQAVALLRQGYHISRVVSKTGWGPNHFRNLVDDTGYVAL